MSDLHSPPESRVLSDPAPEAESPRVNAVEPHSAPNEVLHGDTWEVRDGRAVVVGSNRWPAPKPGSHESDVIVFGGVRCPFHGDPKATFNDTHDAEYRIGAAWSRANQEETTS